MKVSRTFALITLLLTVNGCQAINPLEWIFTVLINLVVGSNTVNRVCDELISIIGPADNLPDQLCSCTSKADLWWGIVPVGIRADALCDSGDSNNGQGCFSTGEFIPTDVQFCTNSILIELSIGVGFDGTSISLKNAGGEVRLQSLSDSPLVNPAVVRLDVLDGSLGTENPGINVAACEIKINESSCSCQPSPFNKGAVVFDCSGVSFTYDGEVIDDLASNPDWFFGNFGG